ncbi:MAG: OPT/YSL family transporter [Deltaproteobacteria bacterium]|nr:OPT/YSL family transporter [Deltaproteobacteria bacterium]
MNQATDEDPETVWLRDVYRPNEPNLTVRAVIGGIVIGAVMCLSNIYVFFKTGWSLGVTLTACILAFAAFQFLQAIRVTRKPLSILENNALTTVASGAGYMTAGGNAAAFGALMMATTVRPDSVGMIAWFGVIAAMGVFAAIPIKRQLINKEALPFPTGTATAETIRSIHNAAAGKGASAGKALLYSALFGAALAWIRDAWKLIPGTVAPGLSISGHSFAQWTLALKTEVVLFAAGALMSFRTGWSLLLGGVLTYAVLGPSLLDQGLITEVSYKSIVAWTLWPGAALLVGAGLTSFALDWKSLARAFTGIGKVFRKHKEEEAGIDAVESPEWWFPAGFFFLTPIIVILMSVMFHIPVWAALIAVPLAVLMGFVAARVTGETDVTPTKALGPVTQMMYGVITPGNLSGNIMSANVTGGIGLHAADLLTTLKTGWLLGAKPRHQLYAQLFGVLAGAAIVVPAFNLVIPDPSVLGGDEWPAPSCVVWAGVSKAFSYGLDSLHDSSVTAIYVGLGLGIVMAIVEKYASKEAKAWIPSPYGIGLAMVVPASNSIMMFLGAVTAELIRRKAPSYNGYVVPVASGLIAGESLMGIAISMLTVAGVSLAL